MNWSTNKPTDKGYYWMRSLMDDGAVHYMEIVQVYKDSIGDLCVSAPSEDWDGEKVSAFDGSEWAGPIQKPDEPLPARGPLTKSIMVVAAVLCALVPVPTFAEQVVLDGREFAAHLDKDKQVVHERDALRVDRDNLEQQVTLYRQNETNYKQVIKRLKELDAKTTEKDKVQQEMLISCQAREERNAAREQELIAEVRKVKTDQVLVTWKERGTAFLAGAVVTLAVVAVVLRGGR